MFEAVSLSLRLDTLSCSWTPSSPNTQEEINKEGHQIDHPKHVFYPKPEPCPPDSITYGASVKRSGKEAWTHPKMNWTGSPEISAVIGSCLCQEPHSLVGKAWLLWPCLTTVLFFFFFFTASNAWWSLKKQ